jgi:pimeloyl-ACP methyl ester carboxylesterase
MVFVTRLPIGLLITALGLVGCSGHARPKVESATGLLPGSVVEADGNKIYFRCEGKGSPTVVFLSGWGEDTSSWASVFDGTSTMTRSCLYDRAGVGESAPYGALPRRARDAHDQARELDQLLRNGGIAKPYVLVGHSWGGSLARLYAGSHHDVKAVVFIDSSSPGQDAAIAAALPPKKPGEASLLTELRQPHNVAVDNPEYLAWGKSLDEVGEVTNLGDLPEIVITAGNTFAGLSGRLFPVWLAMQKRLAALSSRTVQVLARSSGHSVQQDAPELVLAAVRAAVNAARSDGHLATCAVIFRDVRERTCLR